MKARRERLARALSLSNKLWRLQTMRLAQIETILADLRDQERTALEALERNFADPILILKRLQILTQRRVEAEDARCAQLARVREQGRRAKQTERLFERVDNLWRRDQAAEELRRLSERDDVRAP
ncbi:hypothetical protein LG047_06090 [Methylocystis sp. WRRC1]|uniref:hypothetical protein n=1 Tax=Methylocystis sp. WRRC1 TaxID=1732014 RepID=UPI001D13F8CC|nr:hypothetical protein [Methylocystis sp. WRRC1]MCC3244892.1 hypothetical protein [Methylocystis sp. WRRC1]